LRKSLEMFDVMQKFLSRHPFPPGDRVVSDFNALHSGKHNEEMQLCAFDLLALWRRLAGSAAIDTQGESCAAASTATGWDFREPVRERRDRA
jgi:hypothetical protein